MGTGAEAVVLDYNWRRYQRVVDIGGAYGSFLARVLRRNTKAAGVLFDQPQAICPFKLCESACVLQSARELGATARHGFGHAVRPCLRGLLHLHRALVCAFPCHSKAASARTWCSHMNRANQRQGDSLQPGWCR